mmetsp:Transcript_21215/g.48168  ORF Transcript_21215/g.48168 Transcript_21215/m.48168 type:complete len:283 (-) Transcript_21215:353-1201(-)
MLPVTIATLPLRSTFFSTSTLAPPFFAHSPQLGFGLNAGVAVQGAIGSCRKIDVTYISEHVNNSDALESMTQKYGVPVLMSNSFHYLLSEKRQKECRFIDRLCDLGNEEANDPMELYTWDMDIERLWKEPKRTTNDEVAAGSSPFETRFQQTARRTIRAISRTVSGNNGVFGPDARPTKGSGGVSRDGRKKMERLPTGILNYSEAEFHKEEILKIRERYDAQFFETFDRARTCFGQRSWRRARRLFEDLTLRYDDGPSKHFLRKMKENDYLPPADFTGCGDL